ncbi:MAG: hypothetical protein ACYC7D_15285 [Nitrososphaerales archaeon]
MSLGQKHLAKLDNCEQCGALQYLILRERELSYALCLLHIKDNHQTLHVLTKIRKVSLKVHESSQSEAGDVGQNIMSKREIAGQIMALVTKLEKSEY